MLIPVPRGSLPGSVRVSRAGVGVPPVRTLSLGIGRNSSLAVGQLQMMARSDYDESDYLERIKGGVGLALGAGVCEAVIPQRINRYHEKIL